MFDAKAVVLLAIGLTSVGAELMCWSCSSDLDVRCHDHFNTTKFDRFYQQNYQQNNYNPNYPQQNYPQQNYPNQNQGGYNPGYNPGNYQSNPFQSRPTSPYIKPCVFSSYGDRKSVCMKKVQTSRDGRTVTIRDCATLPTSQSVGKCPSESNSYITVDFCEYCETDGCNGALDVRGNHSYALLVSFVLFYFTV